MSIVYASLCDGIGAVHVAWQPLGWRCACTSEIEPFACAVVEHHWTLPNLGDMTKITKEHIHGRDQLELIVGGTPCQSFSLAGLRKGLDDPRGNLALVFLRVVDMARPRWVVWENVPGVLSSSGGRDFGCFLGALGQLGYGWCYRVLDAQFFGVPQRRRRVFVVGHLGDWRPAAAVLLESTCLRGNPSPRRKARASIARALTSSTGGASAKEQQLTFVDGDGRPLNALCFGGGNTAGEIDVSTCLTHHHTRQDFDTETFAVVGPLCSHSAEHGHAMTTQQAVEAGHIVTHPLTARHDSSPDGTGRGVPLVVEEDNQNGVRLSRRAGSIRANAPGTRPGGSLLLAFDCKQDGRGAEDVAPTLRAMSHDASHANAGGQIGVAYPLDMRNVSRDPTKQDAVNRQGCGVGQEGDPAHPCTAGQVHGVAYAFQPRIGRSGRGQPSDVVPALAGADAGATSDSRPCVAVSLKLDNGSAQPIGGVEVAPTIRQGAGPNGTANVGVYAGYAVRRLTPRECERLQGFPDDYTLITFRGKPAADGPRYRALGNSMAVPVMAWIGRRIDLVDGLLRERTPVLSKTGAEVRR